MRNDDGVLAVSDEDKKMNWENENLLNTVCMRQK